MLLALLSQRIFRDMLHLKKNHIFADFGHGIGNACLQAAYTIGCEAKGIELVNARFYVSEALNRSLAKATLEKSSKNVSLLAVVFGTVL